jgi:hypothetical protein
MMKQQKSRFMIKKFPNALVTEDHWGDFPLTHALYAQVSMEVIHFLFKTHRELARRYDTRACRKFWNICAECDSGSEGPFSCPSSR